MRQALDAAGAIYGRRSDRRHGCKGDGGRSLDARQRGGYIHEIKPQLHH